MIIFATTGNLKFAASVRIKLLYNTVCVYIYNHMLEPPSRPAHPSYLVRLVGIAPSLQEEVVIVVKQAGAGLVVV